MSIKNEKLASAEKILKWWEKESNVNPDYVYVRNVKLSGVKGEAIKTNGKPW